MWYEGTAVGSKHTMKKEKKNTSGNSAALIRKGSVSRVVFGLLSPGMPWLMSPCFVLSCRDQKLRLRNVGNWGALLP